jgi:ankyrin repeat protein
MNRAYANLYNNRDDYLNSKEDHELIKAIETENEEIVKAVLDNLDINPNEYYTPLEGDFQLDENPLETPLIVAIKTKKIEIVKALLSHPDIEIDKEFDRGDTALTETCYTDDEDYGLKIIKLLLDKEKSEGGLQKPSIINHRTLEDFTPIYIASFKGHNKILKFLNDHDSEWVISIYGATPLNIAAEMGNNDTIQFLIDNNICDINSIEYDNPLISAIKGFKNNNNVKLYNTVKLLLLNGTDPNIISYIFDSILHLIYNIDNMGNMDNIPVYIEVLKLVIMYGADPRIELNIQYLQEINPEILPEITENDSITPLIVANLINIPKIISLFEKSLFFWRPFDKMPMLNFRLDRPHVYGACAAVLLCSERISKLYFEESDLSKLGDLPPEIWEYIMSFLKMRDMGSFSNRGNRRHLANNLHTLPMSIPSRSSSPRIEELPSNSFETVHYPVPDGIPAIDKIPSHAPVLNNQHVNQEPLVSPVRSQQERLEQGMTRMRRRPSTNSPFQTKLEKGIRRMGENPNNNNNTNPFKQGGGGKKEDKKKLFNLVVKILNMKDEIFESKCKELIGITIYELESLTYMMENMTKKGLYKMPLFLKVLAHVSEYIKPNKKSTLKKNKKKSTPLKKKSTPIKKKSTPIKKKSTPLKKKKHVMKNKKKPSTMKKKSVKKSSTKIYVKNLPKTKLRNKA